MEYAAERRFLADLFGGPFRGHGLTLDPPLEPAPFAGDAAVSERPVRDWLPVVVRGYELRAQWHQALGDDAVPCGRLGTGTEVFAAACGCPVHLFPDSLPAVRPMVFTPQQADRLVPPTLSARPLQRLLELALLVRLFKLPETRYESLFLALPLALEAPRFRVCNAGTPYVVGEEQLPGTPLDFHAAGDYLAVGDGAFTVLAAPLEAPLFQLGGLNTGRWNHQGPPSGARSTPG